MSRFAVLAAALLALAAVLVLPDRAAQAQSATWSATLTTQYASKNGTVAQYGCGTTGWFSSAKCTVATVLTDDDFTFGGTDYDVEEIFWGKFVPILSTGTTYLVLKLDVAAATAKTALTSLTLNVGSTAFKISDATATAAGLRWTNSSLGWQGGETVSVSLTADTTRPAKPTGFTATAGAGRVTLAWTNPSDSTITKWQVRRKTTGAWGSWTDIAGSSATTTSHTVTGLNNGTAYTFQVRAVDAGGNGVASDEKTATPVAATPDSATFTPDPSGWFKKGDTVSVRFTVTPSAAVIALGQPLNALIYRHSGANCTGNASTYATSGNAGTATTATQQTFNVNLTLSHTNVSTASDKFCAWITDFIGGSVWKQGFPLTGFKVDHTKPTIGFPAAATKPTVGQSYSIALGDAHSKLKKYGAIAVHGTTGAAGDCDTATEVGSSNLTTEATALTSKSFSWTVPAGSAGKKVCVYAEDAAGNIHSALGSTAIVAPPAAPTVSSVALTSSVPSNQNGHYKIGDKVTATVTFGANVTVTGTPRLELQVGSNARQAAYAGGTGTAALTFDYTVAEGDADSDGIAIGANKLTLPGSATIKETTGVTDANRNFSAVSANSSHKVDGVRPTITGFTVSSSGPYYQGGSLLVVAQLSEAVAVTGTPTLTVAVGGNDRTAGFVELVSSNTGLRFRYQVQSGDEDTDGISIGANKVTLPTGAAIKDGAGNAATLSHNALPAQSAHKVDAVVPVAPMGFTATAGNMQVGLAWSDPGDDSIHNYHYRQKAGTGSWGNWTPIPNSDKDTTSHTVTSLTNGTLYTFQVRASDAGGNGIGAASAEATATPVAADTTGPTVSGAPAFGGTAKTYKIGDAIEAVLTFNETIVVTGAPRLKIKIGTEKNASCARHSSAGAKLVCTYTVAEGDADTDGIEIEANKLTLNGGTIKDGSNNAATLTHAALAAQSNRKVDGVRPTVTQIGLYSGAGTFDTGDPITVTAQFSEIVDVTGSPTLALLVGDATRTATFTATGSTFTSKWFEYTVQAGDADTDGISIPAGSLTLPSGASIVDDAGNAATLTHMGLAQQSGHKVDTVRPAKPAGFSAAPGNQQVTLSWTNPSDGTIAKWQYRQKTTGAWGSWTDIAGSGATTTTATVTGLNNGTAYTFQIRAVDAVGAGAASDEGTATPGADTTRPAKPAGFTAAAGPEQVTLSWTNPSDSSITKWQVRRKAGTGNYGAWTDIAGSGAGTTTATVTGLTGGTAYTFQVRAVDGVGAGAASDEKSATPTALTAPPAPTRVKAHGRQATAPAPGPMEIFVSWTTQSLKPAGQAPVTGYKVERSTNAGTTWTQVAQNTTPGHNHYTDGGLAADTSRHYRVKATSAAGDSPWSAVVSSTTPAAGAPEPPEGFRAAPGDRRVTLTWTDPMNSSITGWEYRQVRHAGLSGPGSASSAWGAWTAIAGSGAGTVSHTVTGLTNGARYHFQVRAVAGAAKGVESNGRYATPTDGPTGLTAAGGVGSVTLTWDDPMNPAIAGWEYRMEAGAGWMAWTPIPGSGAGTTSHTVRGLAGGKYIFQIRAVYPGGRKGVASGRVDGTVAAAAAGVPERPAWLRATAGDGRVTLAWEKAGREAYDRPRVHGFEYRQRVRGGAWSGWKSVPDFVADNFPYASWTHWTLTGLTNEAAHHFQVRGVNWHGKGPGSDAASATPSGSIPAVAVTPGRDRLTVSWAGQAVPTACGYTVQWKSGNEAYGGSGSRQRSVSGADTGLTITGLAPGTVHGVRVMYTSCPGFHSILHAEVRAATLGEAGAPGRVSRLWAWSGDRLVDVGWDAVFGADGYKVQWRPEDGTWDDGGERVVAGEGTTSYVIKGLEPGKRYAVRVIATRDGAPDAAPSEEKLTRGPVDGVWATPAANGGVDVRWAPTDMSRWRYWGYEVRWKRSDAAEYSWRDRVSVGGATSYRLPGLAGGVTWTVQVWWFGEVPHDGVLGEAEVTLPGTVAAAAQLSAAVRGDMMRIGYDGTLDPESAPAAAAYTVTAAGAERGVAGVSVEGRTVTLRLAQAVGAGDAVTVDYVPPADAGRLRDAGGVETAGFAEVPAENGTAAPPLTASIAQAPSEHGGAGAAFTVRVAFSAPVEVGATMAVREGTVQVAGGRVTRSTRVDYRLDLWEFDIEPGSNGEVTVALAAAADCAAPGAICTALGGRLESALSLTVSGPAEPPAPEPEPEPLTASIVEAPSEHGGEGEAFTVRIGFSAPVEVGATKAVREGTVKVKGGRVTRSTRVDYQLDLWEFDIEPGSHKAVTVRLPATKDCAAPGAICTADGRRLSAAVKVTIDGPPALSVADAKAKEGRDETIDFAVTLSRAAPGEVTVDYETRDGTATAGEDYEAASGTLTFAAGETEKTVSVALLDDAHDEGKERFTLRLSKPKGAWIKDGKAVGTIENSDAMPKAWMARFGRAVSSHLVDALEARLEGASESYVQLGGHRLGGADVSEAVSRLASERDIREEGAAMAQAAGQSMTVKELMMSSAFHLLSSESEDITGPRLSAWGRVAASGFDGVDGEVSLTGTVTTATLGVDGTWRRWLTGLALAYSEGDGSFTHVAAQGGDLASTLTSVHPYVGYTLSDRVKLWGLVGYGSGKLDLGGRRTLSTDLEMSMGALGIRGTLKEPSPEGGLALTLRSDVLWMRMESAAVTDMVATGADASRLRLVLEGSRPIALASGGVLTPSLEVGLRHDGGDAEAGSGLEVGGRLHYASAWGLSIEASVRGLLAHEAQDYEEWGASGSLRLDPGAKGRGLTASVMPTWGMAGSGVERLWGQPDAASLAAGNASAAAPMARLDAELGYGLAVLKGQGLLTPYARVALSEGSAQAWQLGTRLALAESLNLSLEASRLAREGDVTAHELALRANLGW